MSRTIRKTPRTHTAGGAVAVDESPEKRRYLALQNIRIGDRLREPGTELTAADLAARNIGSMLRHGQITQIIEPTAVRAGKGKRK